MADALKTKYHQHLTNLIKEYNKRNKDNELTVPTLDQITELFNKINRICICDCIFYSPLLHRTLVTVIDGIYSIAKKKKVKDKHFQEYLKDVEYLENWLYLHEDDIKANEDVKLPHQPLMENALFARYSVDKYISLLVSKTIDYLPQNASEKLLQQARDGFVAFRTMLYNIIDDGLVYWVYPFTENYHYTPINLNFLNGLDRLGDMIETWSEAVDEKANKLSEFFMEEGIDCFSGWGLLGNELTVDNGTMKPKPKAATVREVVIEKSLQTKLEQRIAAHCYMYIACDMFHPNKSEHATVFCASLACVIGDSLGHDVLLRENQVRKMIANVKTMVNRSEAMRRRRDKKYWLLDNVVKGIMDTMRLGVKENIYYDVWRMLTHALDVAVADDSLSTAEETFNNHRKFLIGAHNRAFNSKEKYTENEIKECIRIYQRNLLPIFYSFTDPTTHWVFISTLTFWLNIRDDNVVSDIYSKLKDIFTQPQEKETIEYFKEHDVYYFKILGYGNKESLLSMIDNNPFDVIDNHGSKALWNEVVKLCRDDVERPKLIFSDQQFVFHENGITIEHQQEE